MRLQRSHTGHGTEQMNVDFRDVDFRGEGFAGQAQLGNGQAAHPHGTEGRCGVPSPSHPPGQEEEGGTAGRLFPGAEIL